ncbi:MAG: hypothetical protein ACE5GW_09190, partial [Planctomycetota bacterium]
MNTEQDRDDALEAWWQQMLPGLEAGDAPAVIDLIQSIDDDRQRREIYALAQRAMAGREWPGKSLDLPMEVAQAGIAEGLRQAEAAEDPATAAALTDFANVLSYNLSADLADCWPGDELPREPRHFEAGRRAAEDCLRWRRRLEKGPIPFAIAHWALGIHQISLGDREGARGSFQDSFDRSREAARAEGATDEVGPEGTFHVNLASGYLGIAEAAAGDSQGKTRYEGAIEAFETQAREVPDK